MSLNNRIDRMNNFVTMSANHITKLPFSVSIDSTNYPQDIAFMVFSKSVITSHQLAYHYFDRLANFLDDNVLQNYKACNNLRLHVPISLEENQFMATFLLAYMASSLKFKLYVYGDMDEIKAYVFQNKTEYDMFQVIKNESEIIDIRDGSFVNHTFPICKSMVGVSLDDCYKNEDILKIAEQSKVFNTSIYIENLIHSAKKSIFDTYKSLNVGGRDEIIRTNYL